MAWNLFSNIFWTFYLKNIKIYCSKHLKQQYILFCRPKRGDEIQHERQAWRKIQTRSISERRSASRRVMAHHMRNHIDCEISISHCVKVILIGWLAGWMEPNTRNQLEIACIANGNYIQPSINAAFSCVFLTSMWERAGRLPSIEKKKIFYSVWQILRDSDGSQ